MKRIATIQIYMEHDGTYALLVGDVSHEPDTAQLARAIARSGALTKSQRKAIRYALDAVLFADVVATIDATSLEQILVFKNIDGSAAVITTVSHDDANHDLPYRTEKRSTRRRIHITIRGKMTEEGNQLPRLNL